MKMHRAKIQNCSEICELEQTTRQCVVYKQTTQHRVSTPCHKCSK